MIGVGGDKENKIIVTYIDKSKINLDELKKIDQPFDMIETFIIEIIDENGNKYINQQFIPLLNDLGDFYYNTIPLNFDNIFERTGPRVLRPETESVDDEFELNANEQYTIKLKQNNKLVIEEQVTTMDLDLMNEKL